MSIEDKYREFVSVVYPAVAPNDQPGLPIDRDINCHVTLTSLGEISDLGFDKDELVTALRDIDWENIQEAAVESLALFGPDNDFLVMTLTSDALRRNRNKVNTLLESMSVPNVNKYPDFRPHISLRHDYKETLPTPDSLPESLELGNPTLWWGTEAITLTGTYSVSAK